jgi:5-(carboxyamino)imidazole ribonucleotide mutase
LKKNNPLIALVLGSDSDFDLCKKAINIFIDFNVSYELKIISAHKDTEKCLNYAKNAKKNGIKVIIAFAGMSAHLGGVLAANTTIPVIAVPLNRSSLSGLDALLSIIQMPSGIPVATVGIDSSANAAYLALRILAINDKEISKKLVSISEKNKDSLIKKETEVLKKIKNEFKNS